MTMSCRIEVHNYSEDPAYYETYNELWSELVQLLKFQKELFTMNRTKQ